MSKQFYVEYDGDIDCSNKELGYMKCYEKTIDGYKEAVKDLKTHKSCQAKQISYLEAKLAESEKRWVEENEEKCELKKQLKFIKDEIEVNFVDGQKYNELKQQLAEKNRFLRLVDKDYEKLEQQLAEKEKEFKWLHQKFAKHVENNQDKISFAVSKLEKVSDWIIQHRVKPFFEERYIVYTKSLVRMIKEEIEQLKGVK